MKSEPPTSRSPTRTIVRERCAVFATRSKQENCPFHLGFMRVAILVTRKIMITSGNLLARSEKALEAGVDAKLSYSQSERSKELVIPITHQRDREHNTARSTSWPRRSAIMRNLL